MCTALSVKSKSGNYFFGRNMDLSYNFNQSVMIIQKGYKFKDIVTDKIITNNRAIIGMGTVIDNHPALADAMNENGLACAGLNFNGYAYYEKNIVIDKINIPPYDFIQWVLSNHDTVDEVKDNIKNIELVDIPINNKTKVPTLHWIIVDKSGKSIVVEKTKDKFCIYDNTVGVLTNNPTFDWHLTNLNQYINISEKHPKNNKWSDQKLRALATGAGTLGMPGDFTSVSRFIRSAYIRDKMPIIDDDINVVTQFFNMLDYVKMVKGGVVTEEGLKDVTIYSSCMDQKNCIYYYKTYDNNRINAIDMNKEELLGNKIKLFKYETSQDINYQN